MAAVTAAGGAVVRCGHLRKLKTMKKKFFVLRGDSEECSARLEYYESEKKYKAGATARRALPLRSCFNITRRLDLKQKHVIALFTKEEQFCVVAESELDLHEWLSALLRLHRADDHSDQITHPIQHVWQVNVQKKGLGASKNVQGLYNLCLTDKTLTLVKIKSHNNIISELGIPERVEYTLKNIRRCGDSECFFYMEVGRQTSTGAGELWMLADDSNIAQSMHSTIYHAMRNCAKESEDERDHIILPGKGTLDLSHPPPARRQTYSDGSGRSGLINERGLCVGSCIKQCVCQSATTSIDDSAVPLPLSNNHTPDVEHNPLTSTSRVLHQRTASLPAGCALFPAPLAAPSAPLVAPSAPLVAPSAPLVAPSAPLVAPLRVVHERTRSAPLTGDELDRVISAAAHSSCRTINDSKKQWSRRASTGTRFSKLSPAHTKNMTPMRHRCDSVPSRAALSDVIDRRAPSVAVEGGELARSSPEAEWGRTPRIPEEPDWSGYVPMGAGAGAGPGAGAGLAAGAAAGLAGRAARAYSVGSRPAARALPPPRHRAYSAGARRPKHDLMELDFTSQARHHQEQQASRSAAMQIHRERTDVDEYVDMSPRAAPAIPAAIPAAAVVNNVVVNNVVVNNVAGNKAAAPDGYVEMSYGKSRGGNVSSISAASEDGQLGSQTIFPFSPEDDAPHALTTLSELTEDCTGSFPRSRRSASPAESPASPPAESPQSAEARPGSSPAGYVRLASAPVPVPADTHTQPDLIEGATPPLNYAALDLQPRSATATPLSPHYTSIDFVASHSLANQH